MGVIVTCNLSTLAVPLKEDDVLYGRIDFLNCSSLKADYERLVFTKVDTSLRPVKVSTIYKLFAIFYLVCI